MAVPPPSHRSIRRSVGLSAPAADPPSTNGPAEELAEQLAEELATAWRQGRQVLAEEVIAAHPELSNHPSAAIRLIYEEMCLREESGQNPSSAEVVRRFPQWRDQLEDFLPYYRLLHRGDAAACFPEVGDLLGDFRLLAELGRGALGRVYLATQPTLADRPLVLKVTPCIGQEHLSLARLQHTHIVPLYWVQDFPDLSLRTLCMPYLGGVTLAQVLAALHADPPDQRTGQDFLKVLDQAQVPLLSTVKGPALVYLAQATYVHALTWIGICLAEALQYAHERGLIHLDLKPSNVLLAADGQPMILDFHLARQPIQSEEPVEWLGGTPGYMSPEQRAGLLAVSEHRPVSVAVDGRSDIYSLGLLLYEALGGSVSSQPETRPVRLDRCNPQVTTGLADIIHKCLAPDADDRYQDAAALADDLRRFQSHLPLQGVPNRDWLERWRKWRRRRPHAPAFLGMLATVLVMVLLAATIAFSNLRQQLREAQTALAEGQQQMRKRQHAEAAHTFSRGLTAAEHLPGYEDLRHVLGDQLRLAKRAEAAQRLHTIADRLRFCYGIDSLASGGLQELETRCRQEWKYWIADARRGEAKLETDVEQQLEVDLLDLAILWADLPIRRISGPKVEHARHEALKLLAQAEDLLGPSMVLYRERQTHAESLGMNDLAREAAQEASKHVPRTDWEHYALGRSYLRSNNLALAAAEFNRALELQPQEFWPNFYHGLCSYRLGQYLDAVVAFHVCVALAPNRAECFYNRALAFSQLKNADQALRDYDRALELDPWLAAAVLNRGMLHYQERRYPEAAADLRRALSQGADPAMVHYNLALVSLAQGDRVATRENLRRAVLYDPLHKDARDLLDKLRHKR